MIKLLHTKRVSNAVVVFLVVFLFASCSATTEKNVDVAEKFQVINPIIVDTICTNEYVAEIQSVQNVEIRARVKGFIEKIQVDEGKPVAAGQVLFSLSNGEYKEALLKANAQLKSALAELKSVELEIKNTQLLTEKNIVSKSEVALLLAKKEATEAKIEAAKSEISLANLNLSFTEIRAPFAGVVNRLPFKKGSIVEVGTLLTTLSNNKEVFAYFNVSEVEYLNFKNKKDQNKQEVSLLMANNQPFDQKGTLETTDNEIDKTSGNIAFRARFANPAQLLKHGSSGKVLWNKQLKNAMVIPQKSTFEIQDKLYAYTIDNHNVVHAKCFVAKQRLSNLYVVESGLRTTDLLIYEGIQLVKEGDKITPQVLQANQTLQLLAKQ